MGTYSKVKLDYLRYRKGNPTRFKILSLSIAKAGFRAILLHRISNSLWEKKFYKLSGLTLRFMHHASHCYISQSAQIGEGFLIGHVGGIVIGGKTKIGANCDIRQNVTFGGNFNKKRIDGSTQPIVGNNVSIGAGACILGPVNIGDNSIIGANSVVTRDVSSNVIVSGVPAKEIKKRWDNSTNRRL
jgi:serine O-acetyltransferase